MNKSETPEEIQLPDTPDEKQAALQRLLALFPDTLPEADMEELLEAAVSTIRRGCRSAAELNSRATLLGEDFNYALTPAQLTTALLSLLFARVPASAEEERALTARLVVKSGGPVGYDADEVSGGSGPFGRVATNPVPVAGIVSAELYLRRLSPPDGRPVDWVRTGSRPAVGIDNMVDCYQLTDYSGRELGQVFLSPYHQRISGRAPEGFLLDAPMPDSIF
jgi:hypothetical protein